MIFGTATNIIKKRTKYKRTGKTFKTINNGTAKTRYP